MDERRYRVALEAISETIENFGEDTILAAFATVAERFGWELTKRDPGPCCCAYGDFYECEGYMTPIHECPAPAPLVEDEIKPDPLGDYIFGKVIDMRRRWA